MLSQPRLALPGRVWKRWWDVTGMRSYVWTEKSSDASPRDFDPECSAWPSRASVPVNLRFRAAKPSTV